MRRQGGGCAAAGTRAQGVHGEEEAEVDVDQANVVPVVEEGRAKGRPEVDERARDRKVEDDRRGELREGPVGVVG